MAAAADLEDVPFVDLMTELLRRMKCSTKPDKRLILIDAPIQCYIKRNRTTSTYRLYFGLTPSENEHDKLLLAAKKMRRATSTDFVISLVTDFSRASNIYVGKLRSNFLGTKFTIYDSQTPSDGAVRHVSRQSRRFSSSQVSPKLPAYNYSIATLSYELNVLRTRGPRRINCVMNTILVSSLQEGGTAPTPTSFPPCMEKRSSVMKEKAPMLSFSFPNLSISSKPAPHTEDVLVLENKASVKNLLV